MLKLYTFNVSHFAEKARWALDFERIAYEEKVLLPGPHQLVTRRMPGAPRYRCSNTMAGMSRVRARSSTTSLPASEAAD